MRFTSFSIAMLAGLLVFVNPAMAQDGALFPAEGLAGLGIAIAAFGGAMGQARAISAALDAIGRNPGAAGQMFFPWLLALVFIVLPMLKPLPAELAAEAVLSALGSSA